MKTKYLLFICLLPLCLLPIFSENYRTFFATPFAETTTFEEDDMDNWCINESQLLAYQVTKEMIRGWFEVDYAQQYSLVFRNSLYVFYLSDTKANDFINCCGPGGGKCPISKKVSEDERYNPDPGKCAKYGQGYQFWDYDFIKHRARFEPGVGHPIRK